MATFILVIAALAILLAFLPWLYYRKRRKCMGLCDIREIKKGRSDASDKRPGGTLYKCKSCGRTWRDESND